MRSFSFVVFLIIQYSSMTHLYYYIVAGKECDETTRIFSVSIGQGKQAQRDFLTLTALSVDHGHFFEIRSESSSEFVMRLLESLKPYNVSLQRITARQCVKFLRSCENVPLNPDCLHAAHQQRNAINLDYRIYSRIHRGRA